MSRRDPSFAGLSVIIAWAMALALFLALAPSGRSAPLQTGTTPAFAAQDADGDGLLDSIDPDDDNDGILDIDEGSPDQPTPVPGDSSSPPDADGDAIGDALDPDDNNNGVSDRDEPANPQPPAEPGSGGSTSGDSPDSSSDSGEQLVLALPVTGSGPASAQAHPWSESGAIVLVVLVCVLACMFLEAPGPQRSHIPPRHTSPHLHRPGCSNPRQ